MVEDRIGYRYAKSIFDLAKEKNMLEDVHADMAYIHEVCMTSPDFVRVLESPIINEGKKNSILKEVVGKHMQSDMTKLLTDQIVRKGRERYLDNMAKAFVQLYDLEKHISHAVLTSATPLTDDQVSKIKAQLAKQTGDTIDLVVKVDESLLGGFVLKLGDQLFDGSVASGLRKLRQEFGDSSFERKY
ncbi:MAG: ATP synthase F1 subunit delta [Bacteroidia bacterium]